MNIYDAIKSSFATLPAKQLFRASTGRQVSSSSVMLGVAMKIPAITDRLSAASAIDQLLAEGEGLGDTPKAERATHFARFSEVRREWSKAAARHGFAPCLPVVSNQVSGASEGGAPFGSTVVTNPFSVAVMDLFRDGYRLTLLMLKEFFWGFRWGAGPFEVI